MNNNYISPTKEFWTGRTDAHHNSAFYQIVKLLNLKNKISLPMDKTHFALLGFQCDAGVRRNCGRVGAFQGPIALRQALSKFPVHHKELSIYDAGDIICKGNHLEQAQEALSEAVFTLLSNGITPIVIGGGHEVAWGHYQGIRQYIKNKDLGILNFDAHLDMRELLSNGLGSSGTPFLQIALDAKAQNHNFDYHCIGVQKTGNSKQLFQTASEYNVRITFADDVHQNSLELCHEHLNNLTKNNDLLYLTLCLDVFASGFAPGVSAVQPLGLYPWHTIPLIKKIIKTKKVISYDIAELCPKYDINQCTAKLAASFIYEIVH